MSARGMLTVVGSAVGGMIGLSTPPPLDPAEVRGLLAEVGMPAGDDLAEAVRAFQSRVGLRPDGEAGPRTVHFLTRYAIQRRAWRLDPAA
jgi:hypothetical protein